MYLSKEVHDALCDAGVWAIILMFGTMTIAIGVPWLWRKTAIKRRLLKLYVRLFLLKAMDKLKRRRAARRYKAAMRVFDKPVRWREM